MSERVFVFVSVQQRTCPGLQQRLWQRVRHLRPGSATQLSTTRTRGGSLYLGDLRTKSGSTTFTSWTRRAGNGPWWRCVVCVLLVLSSFLLPFFMPPPPCLLQAQGKVPPLAYHSCSMFRGELFVLGGVFPRPNPEPDGCSDSLYIFDPHLSIWYQPIVTGEAPSPRSGYDGLIQTSAIHTLFHFVLA